MAVADAEGALLLLFLCAGTRLTSTGTASCAGRLTEKLQPELEALYEESRAT